MSLSLAGMGAVLAAIAMSVVGGMDGRAVLVILSPYVALLILIGLVQKFGSRSASRRSVLVTSILLVALTALAYSPVIFGGGGGCMTGLVFVVSIYLLPGVPLVFGVSYAVMRGISG